MKNNRNNKIPAAPEGNMKQVRLVLTEPKIPSSANSVRDTGLVTKKTKQRLGVLYEDAGGLRVRQYGR